MIDKRDEEGLSAPAPVGDLRSVHDIAHPQLAGVAEGESSPVGSDGVAGVFVEQALARKQAVHGGGRKRVYFSSFAYVLMHGLRRLGADGTDLARAQCSTLRLKLLKIGARIKITARRIRLSFGCAPETDHF